MILIADSGSTKTEWCLVEQGQTVDRWTAAGLNPVFQSTDEMAHELAVSVLPHLPAGGVERVCFYGAGCLGRRAEALRTVLEREVGVHGGVEVDTDMLGAAIALCGHEAGIACILGTGSNSCFYDGRRLVANVPPLGFILGDEGSGAVLGKLLVGQVLKRQWPAALSDAFMAYTGLAAADIIDRVYRQPFPNRFLAGLVPFLKQHEAEAPVRDLVTGSFCDFFRRNVMQYDYRRYAAHFTGSVAYGFRPFLEAAAAMVGVRVGHVLQRPMDGLIRVLGRP